MESVLTQEELEAIYSALQSDSEHSKAVDDLIITGGQGFAAKATSYWETLSKSMKPWVEGFISAVLGERVIAKTPEIRVIDSSLFSGIPSASDADSSSVKKVLHIGSFFLLGGIELDLARRFVDRRTGAEALDEELEDSSRPLTPLEERLLNDVFDTMAQNLARFAPYICEGSRADLDISEYSKIDTGNQPFVEIRLYADGYPEAGVWVRGPATAFIPVEENSKKILSATAIQATIELRAILGKARLRVTDVWKLTPGSLITLDSAAGDPLQVYIGNKIKLSGEPLVSRSNLAVKILKNNENGASL
ncbi:MAG: FliM/FliN family flagellar motor switch protein [Deltaproteobacteria bacterium]|nr:FliM/FliN family flagellar motor switch protein [Deltaproteobacteria bacterium]